MADLAYIRVSTVDQNTIRQEESLKAIEDSYRYVDKCSGSSTDRPELKALLRACREGDVVHVHSIDRLARNLEDLLNLVKTLNGKGVAVKFYKENLTFDGSKGNPMQELMLSMLGAVAQFERAIINERQREGIEKAKQLNVYNKPRKKRVNRDRIAELLSEGKSMASIARELSCSTKTVQRIKNDMANG